MNIRRSRSVEKKQLSTFKQFSKFCALHIEKRSFSNPKLQEVLKQKIKKRNRLIKFDLSKYNPVILNFQNPVSDYEKITFSKFLLRHRVIKSLYQKS